MEQVNAEYAKSLVLDLFEKLTEKSRPSDSRVIVSDGGDIMSVPYDSGNEKYDWEEDRSRPTDWEPRTKARSLTVEICTDFCVDLTGDAPAIYFFSYLGDKCDDEEYIQECREAVLDKAWDAPFGADDTMISSLERVIDVPTLIEEAKAALKPLMHADFDTLDAYGLIPPSYFRESAPKDGERLTERDNGDITLDLLVVLAADAYYNREELLEVDDADYVDEPDLVDMLAVNYANSAYCKGPEKTTIQRNYPVFKRELAKLVGR